MYTESTQVFLKKIKEKIAKGDFDNDISVPFTNKQLVYASIKSRIDKKIETGGTPLLSDTEIREAIKDTKEVAAITFEIFKKTGIIVKTEEGWDLSPIGRKIMPHIKPF